NWWGPPGDSGPCGPCSEVYYDYGEDLSKGDPSADPKYGPGGDKGDPRFIEIWNLVFNQYEQHKNGSLTPLAKPGIDTGMGLERTVAVVQNVRSVYETDLYKPVFERIKQETGIELGSSEAMDRALYVLADHTRAMAFLIADGVRPGNQGREYVLRRIIRRAALQARLQLAKLNPQAMSPLFIVGLATEVVEYMKDSYPELYGALGDIQRIVEAEAVRFLNIYEEGMWLLEKEIAEIAGGEMPPTLEGSQILPRFFPGDIAFMLHDTYGFPVEITREVLADSDRDISLDEAGFERAMEEQRERGRDALQGHERLVVAFRDREIKSRFVGYEREQVETKVLAVAQAPGGAGGGDLHVVLAENPFYANGGGQVADEGWISSENGQLEVLDVVPAGDYQVLRARPQRGKIEEGDAVTASINRVRRQQIEANHTATHIMHWALRAVLGKDVVQAGSYVGPDRLRFDYRYTGKVEEADLRRIQEQCLLKITENQPVRYYTTTLEEARNLGAMMLFGEKYGGLVRVVEIDGFSRELCGGTHVRRTAEVGAFKIISNRKHGADLYRIEVLTGREALYYLIRATEKAEQVAGSLRVGIDELPGAISGLQEKAREAREASREQALKKGLEDVGALVESAELMDGAAVVTGQVAAADASGLRQVSDDVKNRLGGPAAVVLAADVDGKAVLIANLHSEVSRRIGAGEIVREASAVLGGRGGGSPTMGQGGGSEVGAIPEALSKARDLIGQRLAGPSKA
ncbi:MAG: alanine--tRNA ligase, partial [Rubrobacter sp.]|nr:alanine--tRNA ligase [Rubrobacter sp.]